MAGINLPGVIAGMSVDELANLVARFIKEVQWLTDGNIDAKNIKAESITANEIKANTITADRMNVSQLSAIAADLGTITAGIIYGAYIATANGTYPRIEFSSVDNLLKAMSDADHHIRITPLSSTTPALIMQSPLGNTLFLQVDDLGGMATSKYISISGGLGVSIASSSGNVKLYDVTIDNGTQLNTLSQADSVATTVAELVADFNSLLAKLRQTNILV